MRDHIKVLRDRLNEVRAERDAAREAQRIAEANASKWRARAHTLEQALLAYEDADRDLSIPF